MDPPMPPPPRNTMGSRAGPGPLSSLGALGRTTGNVPAARMPTRAGGIGPGGNVVGQQGDIPSRPLTTGGMTVNNMGVNIGRQVYDKSYYISKLKQKQQAILDETESLKKQTKDMTAQQHKYNKLETKSQELRKETRHLEGQLADYNLTEDKWRLKTRPEDVKNAFFHVKNQNQKFKHQLDQVFLERKKYEQEIETIQNQLQSIHQQMELRLNELDPYQRTQYQKLINENKELIAQYNVKQRELEQLNNRLSNAEARLRMDSQKLKGQLFKTQLGDLETKKDDLEIQLNEANLSYPQARDRILARMKQDNTTIAGIEKRTKQVKRNIELYQKKLRQLQASIQDKQSEEQNKQKYMILYEKQKQMDEFLSSFEKSRQSQINEMSAIQERIVEHLEQITKILELSGQLPGKDGLTAKTSDKSRNTLAQAKAQYELRMGNLKSLDGAQQRTAKEIEDISVKVQKMREEISEKFDRVDKFKNDLFAKKQQLITDEKDLSEIKAKILPEVSTIEYNYSIAQKKLQMHSAYNQYSEIERKLAQQEAQKYYLKSYINIKSKDMKYQAIKDECVKHVEDLNKILQK